MSDLSEREQESVRIALRALRVRCGGWEPLAGALRLRHWTLQHVATGRSVSAAMAYRVARFADVSVDDVLAGRWPGPNACPHCGQMMPKG